MSLEALAQTAARQADKWAGWAIVAAGAVAIGGIAWHWRKPSTAHGTGQTVTSRHRSLLRQATDWPDVGRLIVTAVALPLAGLQLLGSAELAILQSKPASPGTALLIARWCAAPIFGLWSFVCSRFGMQGAYLAALGLTISLLVEFNFRGDHIRFGTFDFYEESPRSWLAPLLIGFGVGCVVGLLSRLAVRDRPVGLFWPCASLLLVFVAGLLSYTEILNSGIGKWSAFPPTRHLALGGLGLLLLALLLLSEYQRRRE